MVREKRCCGLGLAALTFVLLATATTGVVADPAPPASTTASPAGETVPPLDVTGFRSAKFGMDEQRVRGAIASDFGKGVVIKASVNPAERTRNLTVRVPDVLQGGGSADIAYVLGYKSNKLIQVSIVWSKSTDPSMTAEKLVADADVLKTNFADQGYKPDSILNDVAVRNGLLVFRGADDAGHTTALLLEGRSAGNGDHKTFTPLSLLLLYIADPKRPDVFKLAPGQF